MEMKKENDDALNIVQNNRIVYAPDATMQAMLSDKNGRILIIVSDWSKPNIRS